MGRCHHVFCFFFLSIHVTCHTRRTSSEVSDGSVGFYGEYSIVLQKNVSILDSLLEKATVWLLDHHGIVVTCNGAIGMTRGMSGLRDWCE
ncbi:hypothetical protein J3E72DRAFT_353493 [Bipolaris maydis]|uniref:uncharacterized protein n=1 Tax=Cochliobolus heterostrophus TaxID=5016 RepID=UPI0024D6DDEE|nr:hypothetical protein J3E73DRAFT_336771 [Bipolaris maydis]KAJ5056197.1 hypothetical protein J3E74DRAFT_378580 [Bipolaris maydis]KAJ6193943.1 hypothetical protein J3E72DRAFT_353493 [Bipolaris maydis]KAJ6211924.1 hypothetical protein PSV09DRAFT_2283321 [Bipolaris maydis]KAJ6267150.1 hypothetical protein PSV08DRAFT_329966 [Bipolaris maydis]